MRHIAIVEPGIRRPEIDSFNRMARAASMPLTLHLPALHGPDSLHRAGRELAGIIIFGSAASVHDGADWQRDFDAWLLPQLAAGVPALGLCYGHQHLAHRLGGEVDMLFPDEHKLQGVRRVPLAADRLWGPAAEVPVVVSHQQVVTRLPDGFEVCGSTAQVAIEAFRHPTRPIWGFQSHPEATSAFVELNHIDIGDWSDFGAGHRIVDAFVRFCAEEGR